MTWMQQLEQSQKEMLKHKEAIGITKAQLVAQDVLKDMRGAWKNELSDQAVYFYDLLMERLQKLKDTI